MLLGMLGHGARCRLCVLGTEEEVMTPPRCPTCGTPGVLHTQHIGGRGSVQMWVCPRGWTDDGHRLLIREKYPLEGCEEKGRDEG